MTEAERQQFLQAYGVLNNPVPINPAGQRRLFFAAPSAAPQQPQAQRPASAPQAQPTPTVPAADPRVSANNPVNLGQLYYAGLEDLYKAQVAAQQFALQQMIEQAAAGNPNLMNMLGLLQYSLNEDQLPQPERQALAAQRERNLQASFGDMTPAQKAQMSTLSSAQIPQQMRAYEQQEREQNKYAQQWAANRQNRQMLEARPNTMAQGRVGGSYNMDNYKK